MPRLGDTLVNGDRVEEIRRTIVRLPQVKAPPVVRKHSIWGRGCGAVVLRIWGVFGSI